MAEVVAPASQASAPTAAASAPVPAPAAQHPPPAPQSTSRGRKRAPDGTLENEQRLSKRFDLLNLEGQDATRLYIPVPGSSDPVATSRRWAPQAATPMPVAPLPAEQRGRATKPRPPSADTGMQVDDTPNRVYIHDLAAELSDVESDEENPVFLSDIEKHLSKIPRHILVGPEPKASKDNQLVLYNVPSSLTVPEEQDNVRKAITEARQRVRDRQVNPTSEPPRENPAAEARSILNLPPSPAPAEDPDAMDID